MRFNTNRTILHCLKHLNTGSDGKVVFTNLEPDHESPYELEITGFLSNGDTIKLRREIHLGIMH